jgi:lipoyl(octanoyl) transferase
LVKEAERGGFEPPIALANYDGLANRCLQPLGHLSRLFTLSHHTTSFARASFPTSSMAAKDIKYIDLPVTKYAEVWDMQKRIFQELLDGNNADTLILCEHEPVFTLGRATDITNVLLSDEKLREIGAEKFEIERGGDVTFHGPGQLVGYPLLNLSHFKEDLGWFLRSIEETIILTLKEFGIDSFRVPGRTGVWVNRENGEEKICAIGVKASRWCTMHGFALNVNTDLKYFDYIIPCGIADKKVTSMEKVLGKKIEMSVVKDVYHTSFEDIFLTT